MPTIESANGSSARERRTLILVLVCLAQFMVLLDISIVNVALPSIRKELGFDVAGLQWVVNAYTLSFAGLLLLGGRAADIFGQRKIFLLGVALFGVASLAGGLAQDQGLLIAARALQGVGGAVLSPATLTVLTTTFTERHERTRAMGIWSAVAGAGGAAGALLGGIFTDFLGWRWIFFLNIPIAAVAFIAAQRLLHGRNQRHANKLDAVGALLVTTGLVSLVYAIVSTEQHGWTSVQTIAGGLIGLALLTWFVLHEQYVTEEPLMPLSLWKIPSLAIANLTMFLIACGMFAMWFFISLDLQNIRGYSPLKAGLAFLPQTLGIVAGAQLASRFLARVGARTIVVVACLMGTGGLIWLSRLGETGSYAATYLVPGTLITFGLGLCMTPVVASSVAGVRPQESGLASGLINTSRQVGGSIGLAALATIASDYTQTAAAGESIRQATHEGYQRGFLCGSIFLLLAALVALRLPNATRANNTLEAASLQAELAEA